MRSRQRTKYRIRRGIHNNRLVGALTSRHRFREVNLGAIRPLNGGDLAWLRPLFSWAEMAKAIATLPIRTRPRVFRG